MEYKVKELGYDFDALLPHIDRETMQIHHDKHYAGYVKKLNVALDGHDDLKEKPIAELITEIDSLPEEVRTAVKNNGGGAVNHEMFWEILKKDVKIGGDILEAINTRFGSVDEFKKEFSDVSTKLFGSGWAWLVVDGGKLEIMATTGHETPLSVGKKPVLVLDIWEHAYYLKYQNRRPEYIESFWNVVNWDRVNKYYKEAIA